MIRNMLLLSLVIAGDPVPKGRPKHSTANGRQVTYTPARTRDAQDRIIVKAKGQLRGRKPFEGRVGVRAKFYCATRIRCDGDNLLKLLTDALNKVVYADDSQIEEWHCQIERGVGKAAARTEVEVYVLDDPPVTAAPRRPRSAKSAAARAQSVSLVGG